MQNQIANHVSKRLMVWSAVAGKVLAVGMLAEGQTYVYRTVDTPVAVVTSAFCNNNYGQIIGRDDTDLQFSGSYGYVLTQGVLKTIAYPGAAVTIAACANNNGEVVGG